jgi:hypothetical protein
VTAGEFIAPDFGTTGFSWQAPWQNGRPACLCDVSP